MTYSYSDLADDIFADIIERKLAQEPTPDYADALREEGHEARHDHLGFYVCSAAEAAHEDAGNNSVGFDGRPHYATLEEAARTWLLNIGADLPESDECDPSQQADIILAGIANVCAARDQAFQIIGELCGLIDVTSEHHRKTVDIARALIAGTAPTDDLTETAQAWLEKFFPKIGDNVPAQWFTDLESRLVALLTRVAQEATSTERARHVINFEPSPVATALADIVAAADANDHGSLLNALEAARALVPS